MNLILARPCVIEAHMKLVMLASEGAAVTAATAKLSWAGLMVSTPAKPRFTITLTTPPSIAPSIMGRNHHATSSRP